MICNVFHGSQGIQAARIEFRREYDFYSINDEIRIGIAAGKRSRQLRSTPRSYLRILAAAFGQLHAPGGTRLDPVFEQATNIAIQISCARLDSLHYKKDD